MAAVACSSVSAQHSDPTVVRGVQQGGLCVVCGIQGPHSNRPGTSGERQVPLTTACQEPRLADSPQNRGREARGSIVLLNGRRVEQEEIQGKVGKWGRDQD